ncbi:MAG: YrvL family regulatory protein [[Clostridium] nexile]
MRKKVLDFFGFIICVAVVLGIVSVIALVGGSIMKIFGFRYESVGKIILFFLIFAIVGFPTEVFAQALPNALLSLDRISFLGAKVLFVFLDTISTTIAMAIVDHYEGCVSLVVIHICDCIFICNHVFR